MLFIPGEEGQGLLEYGLVIVLAAIVVVAILLLVGPSIGNLFSHVMEELPF
jgi:pilus assembly protein Flp/PilA